MQSKAATVEEYLAELPDDRREAITAVRKVILKNLPKGIVETMSWGMISYEVPLSVVPDTYNGKPLSFAAIASQKNYMAVYLMSVYAKDEVREEFEAAYRESGKKLDMGQSCVRFKKLDDLPLDVVGKAIKAVSMKQYVEHYDHTRSMTANKKAAK